MNTRAHLAVALAAVIFGTTFFVVKDALKDVGTMPFLAVRFLVGAAVLSPWIAREWRQAGSALLRAGALCGLALGSGYIFQTAGLRFTTTSVSAFITYLLVVLVPLLSALVLRQPPSPSAAAGVVLATAGLFLLTGGAGGFGRGEALTLGCALAFAVHILLLSRLAPRYNAFALNGVQLAVVGLLCLVPGLAGGGYGAFTVRAAAAAVYTGVAASAVALGLQVWGQRQVGPTRTSLLLMIEPVSAAVVGAAIGEHLGLVGLAGAALILAGIALAEVPLNRPLTARSSSGDAEVTSR